jgi:branched-chain amino acid transport system substrate-binding protein
MRPVGALLSLALATCGCGQASPRITIGTILSQTGSVSTNGLEHLQAVQLAADEINAAGGLLGHTLAVVNVDDHSDPTQATAAAQSLVDHYHPPAILGAITSGATTNASTVTIANQVMLMSGSATATSLGGVSPLVARTCPDDSLQGQLLAERAIAKGFANQRVAIAHVPGPYGSGLAGSFATHFTQLGGTVTINQELVEKQSSYTSLLTQLYATSPDAILLVAYPVDAAQVVSDYNTAFSFKQTFWFFTDSTRDSSFARGQGASSFTFMHEGTGSATPTTAAFASFAAAFMARYGSMPLTYSANYYDAAYLVALAAAAAGRADGPSVAAQLRTVADPPGLVIGPGQWAQALMALRASAKINYEGASGSVDVDGNGNVLGAYDIWKVEGGQLVITERSVLP